MDKLIPLRLPFLFLLLLQLFGFVAQTYYVAPSGDNSQTGLSPGTAWASLQHAADQVDAGDIVLVANGTYDGFQLTTGGSSGQLIRFIANGDNVVINAPNTITDDGINVEGADWVEINGFRVINQPRNGIRVVLSDDCIVRNNECDNNFERGIFTGFTNRILIENNICLNSIDEHGIYFSNSADDPVIRNNICHHNNGAGIQINADASQGGDGITTGAQIYGNVLFENGPGGGAAINLDGVQGAFIYNNLLYENHATGIALFQIDGGGPSTNALIVHNTIIQASDGRWCALVVDGAIDARFYNNIMINQHPWRGSIAVDADALSGLQSDFNVFSNSMSTVGDGTSITLAEWQAFGYDGNSLLADPLPSIFESPSMGGYELKDGAQAIDAGSASFSFGVTQDIVGTMRPAGIEHDIGAYESDIILAIEDLSLPKDSIEQISSRMRIYTDQNGILCSGDIIGMDVLAHSMNGKQIAFRQNIEDKLVFIPFSQHPAGMYLVTLTKHHVVVYTQMIYWPG
jgi:parallel beta-helix repeat protein